MFAVEALDFLIVNHGNKRWCKQMMVDEAQKELLL